MNRIREKSLAWYAKKYWKPVAAITVVAGLTIGATVAFAGEETTIRPKYQEYDKTRCEMHTASHRAWDVPLDDDLQLYIFELSERYGIEPELILAVIGQESNYKADKIGDNGNSYGLMQVQPIWHEERMNTYNVTDLLNPYENVLIGVDYLAECIEKGGLEWGLMAYNGGASYANEKTKQGVVSEYAESVMLLAELLEGERNV